MLKGPMRRPVDVPRALVELDADPLASCSAPLADAAIPGGGAGYEWLSKVRGGRCDGRVVFSIRLRDLPGMLTVESASSAPFEIFAGACPDNPADRDHCIQYMVAVPILFGRLTAADYEDSIASDPRIDALRDKMECVEDPAFTRDYHDPEKRSIANALTVEFNDGSKLEEIVCEYPIGHKRRRGDGIPLLEAKFRTNLARMFPAKQQQRILEVSLDQKRLEQMPVHEYVDMYVI